MVAVRFDPGSYRDPSGHVFTFENRIFRTVNASAAGAYESAREAGVFSSAEVADMIVSTAKHNEPSWCDELGAEFILEHQRIPFISYPYEWCFPQLKQAALLHLRLHLKLLELGYTLTDASVYNVQFVGPKPVFIDVLSIRPYRDGEHWLGHRQFCEQFLNPLLLRSYCGIAHNAWFRGSLEGISTVDINRLLPFRHRLSLNVLSHVSLPARLARSAASSPSTTLAKAKNASKLSKSGFVAILRQLEGWISKLEPAGEEATTWGDYAANNTYSSAESQLKAEVIERFAATHRPAMLIDLGCNNGDFSAAALRGGAGYVVGCDFDQTAVANAYKRSLHDNLAFIPTWLDASNPSPDQGWRQMERKGFAERARADAVIALAFEHHLAIAKNIPLQAVVEWIVDMAPRGIIEFVPKDDPTVATMLALREDIFPDYDEPHFVEALQKCARISSRTQSSASGRVLFEFDRSH